MSSFSSSEKADGLYALIRSLTAQELFLRQLPVLVTAFVVASLFYRFGSFALECIAFLATWFVLDLVVQKSAGRGVQKSAGRAAAVTSKASAPQKTPRN